MAAQQAVQATAKGRDVSILTRSVENVFRNLVRLLIGKLTLRRLLDLLREIFVQEAEAQLRRERPGRNVPLSQLALLTGLDTRTLIRIRGDISARQVAGDERIQIKDLSPEARVVEMWMLRAPYLDAATGEPRALSYGGPGSEFEALVKEVVTSRGVTVQSIVERLEATGSVRVDSEGGKLELVKRRYSPFDSEDEMGLMSTGMQAIMNLTASIGRNIRSAQEDRVIQRELWTFRLDPDRREEFRGAVRDFLLRVEHDAEAVMEPLESDYRHDEQLTAGIGFYYFEEDTSGS